MVVGVGLSIERKVRITLETAQAFSLVFVLASAACETEAVSSVQFDPIVLGFTCFG